METRYLGQTGIAVSVLSYGAMSFGGGGPFTAIGTTQEEEATRLVDLCLDAGVNLFDTADVYSAGRSEEILGAALGRRRDGIVLATKLHGRTGPGPNDAGQSRAHIVQACEDSLRRLGTDWIDLYQVHGFDARVSLDESLSALDDLVRSGKVRAIGCSNYSAWQLMKALAVSDARGVARYCVEQAYYSLVGRELEHDIVPVCLDQGVGVLVWGPLASGFLTGKYRRGQVGPAGARRSSRSTPPIPDDEQAYDLVEALDEIGRAHGGDVAQAALNWLVRKPGVTSVIVGARNEQQLSANLAAATWSLTDDEMRRLDRLSARPLPYPNWHQEMYNQDRLPPIPAWQD